MTAKPESKNPRAAFIIIGNEILSGRTQDLNLQFLGSRLAALGIDLAEVRVVADEHDAIIEAVNKLRERYRYVFTSGGIGPTHDDITTESIARAFGVRVEQHPEAVQRMRDYYRVTELTDSRLRMANIPVGADLIDNPVSSAPGYRIDNVFVFAGVPSILQAMFDGITHSLGGGPPIEARSVSARISESRIAQGLGAAQEQYPTVTIGSYPFVRGGKPGTMVVVRSSDGEALEAAFAAVQNLLQALDAEIIELG